jgi:hypothetical protein
MTLRRLVLRTATVALGGAVMAGIVAVAVLGVFGALLPRSRRSVPE